MSDFDTNQAENIGADLAGLIGELFGNVVSAQNLGLPQYEDILERIAELGKQAEEHLEKYRAWQDGKEVVPDVMPTEINPGEILEQIAPLFTDGGIAAKITTDLYSIQNHVFDTESRCIISITWREPRDSAKAREVYRIMSRIKGISRVEWEYNQH